MSVALGRHGEHLLHRKLNDMNPIIKSQLDKCRVANIPQYDDSTTELLITKGTKVAVSPYQVNKCYIVELADHIVHPSEDSTLASNWNRGIVPKHKYYKCVIMQVMGKMVKITGCGYDLLNDQDTNDMWDGWVPQSGIQIIKELD